MNRTLFYNAIRATLFKGKLTTLQVQGIDAILNEWEKRALCDLRWLAYMLATTYWETAKTMQPIEEYGKGKGRSYGVKHPVTGKIYYGRGFVQLTWWGNYRTMGNLLGVDLVNKPELALNLEIATQILFEGMLKGKSNRGDFTGVSLETFFTPTSSHWYNARKIINGLDHAADIANIAIIFYQALTIPA